ncbi:hypothetical protein DPMN_175217 [Dreissena polymorpha]|uniref:Uncharacterized protein n=1 Tax=Dreissena polymorpha TaxID=45954 RepID=A0A9D4E7T4_DREPO|nr:hypothetical protein DPMN_175217 [Dreissena polymorpha]
MSNIQDTRFRDSRGMFVQSILFEFDHVHAEHIQHLLQSKKVFAWTANSNVGPCSGRIKIPVFTRPDYQHNYVIFENENGEYDDQGAVGPPVAQSFGVKGDRGPSYVLTTRMGMASMLFQCL